LTLTSIRCIKYPDKNNAMQAKYLNKKPLTGYTFYAAIVISALVLITYAYSFNAGFHFDDEHQIEINHYMRTLSSIPGYFTGSSSGGLYGHGRVGYRPFASSMFTLCYVISGGKPWSFHLANTALHILNALLVMLIADRVLRLTGDTKTGFLPLAISLVFALHPVQTNAVTYISAGAVLLASLFWLCGLWCYMRYRDGGGKTFFILSAVCYFAALLC
jgi:protein O-mannosyl-transferase